MTIVLVIGLASCAAALVLIARKRAEQRAAQAQLAKLKAARKARVPVVSNNLKGVTASQTIQPSRPAHEARAEDDAG